MKKISTVAAHKIEKVEGQKLTIGLDLGDRSSWYCVLDERSELLLEQKLATTPKAMREVFGGMPRSWLSRCVPCRAACARRWRQSQRDRCRNKPGDLLLLRHGDWRRG